MKLRLGDVLIETNYIEMADKVAPHTVKLFFLSGKTLDVHCGVKSEAPATWNQDAEGLLRALENTDRLEDSNDK